MTKNITRRQAVGLAGAAGAAVVVGATRGGGSSKQLLPGVGTETAAAATPACVLTPAKTEGPYFVDEKLNRADIRTDPSDGSTQAGTKLALTIQLLDSDNGCGPLPGAVVDIWHANATGTYSDESANNSVGKKYLRGYQVTGADGKASFVTVYPGWYQGRAIHIHFKIRLYDGTSKTYEFTSQIFFDPATSAKVMGAGAYAGHGQPGTSNSADNIYGSDGSKLLVDLQSDGDGGYAGTFSVGLSGLPAGAGSTTTTTNSVAAALAGTSFRRTKTGRRVLRATLIAGETLAVTARLSRNGATLVRKHADALTKGTRTLDLRLPPASAGGKAKLTLVVEDSAGATKTLTKSVTVPKRGAV
jgi:protocatechuate 3,4-dioxygenase beta subunit